MKLPSFKWRKTEERILEELQEHARLCKKAFNSLKRIVNSLSEKMEEVEKDGLFKAEEKADELRRKIVEELARGVLPPLSRGDVMEFVRRLDLVIDWIKDAERIFSLLNKKHLRRIKKDLNEYVEKIGLCVESLIKAVYWLEKDFEKALRKCYEVEKWEREVDKLYLQMFKRISRQKFSSQEFFFLLEFIKALENVADAAENTADQLRILIISTFY